jgi:hypothetical protein
MKKPKRARRAKLEQVLVYYDQPQVVYLVGDRGYKILAVAVEHKKGMSLPFFASEISDSLFNAYLAGRVDLNFALRQGKRNRYSFFDWGCSEDGENFELRAATVSEIADDSFYPEPGFFSEHHSHRLTEDQLIRPAKLAFHIDGKWDASDLSRFVGRIDEIYSFARLIETGSDTKLTAFLRAEIAPRAWTHGGDYTQFYRSLKSRPEAAQALRVESIAYNSPGRIVVRGEQDALREVADVVEAFKESPDAAITTYTVLRQLLSREGYLSRKDQPEAPSEGIRSILLKLTYDLLKSVGMQNSRRLLDACRNDAVVFAKVSLSLIRRVREAAEFYAEGRVSSDKFVEAISSSSES